MEKLLSISVDLYFIFKYLVDIFKYVYIHLIRNINASLKILIIIIVEIINIFKDYIIDLH